MSVFKSLSIAAALVCAASTAMAEKLSGQEVAALFAKGTVSFQAGSVWQTLPGNTYTFKHRSYSEAGTFKIFGNGNGEILDEATGKKVTFFFDRGADGLPALIYTTGGKRSKPFPIK